MLQNGYQQWAVGSGQWAVGSGQWAVGSGQWTVGSGQWTVDSGQWTVDSGQWTVVDRKKGGGKEGKFTIWRQPVKFFGVTLGCQRRIFKAVFLLTEMTDNSTPPTDG